MPGAGLAGLMGGGSSCIMDTFSAVGSEGAGAGVPFGTGLSSVEVVRAWGWVFSSLGGCSEVVTVCVSLGEFMLEW